MIRATPVYQEPPERRGVSQRRVVDETKAKVPIMDLADLLCGPTKMGCVDEEWGARCPLKDHEGKMPSFTVNPEKNSWFCHGCLRGGDVVELARFAWDFEKSEVAMAAAYLLREFGYDVPQRPATWYRRQGRQAPIRAALERTKISRTQRWLCRWMCAPASARFTDEAERHDEARIARNYCGQVSLMVCRARGERV
jgi:hypothetical protein